MKSQQSIGAPDLNWTVRARMQCLLVAAITLAGVVLTWGVDALAELPEISPRQLGLDEEQLEKIDAIVLQAIEEKKLPGCVVSIGRRGAIGRVKAYGLRQVEPAQIEMTVDTVFDLASLTKPIATATSVMILAEQGALRIQDPVARYLPEFAQNGKEDITIEQLLTHQGGIIPDNPLADYKEGQKVAFQKIWELQPTEALGKEFIYSDVGFIVLGEVVRRVTGNSVANFAEVSIFEPLGMYETCFVPNSALAQRAAPTEQRDSRWMVGTVHDPRAELLGGVAGHAGLFSTASDLASFANMLLSCGTVDGRRILGCATIKEMIRPRNIDGQLRALGWDIQSKYSSNRGEFYSTRAFGHGGFTGTAIWVDPELDLFVVFLANRLHPDGKGNVNHLAGRIGSIAAAAIMDNTHAPLNLHETEVALEKEEGVFLGIDILQRNDFSILKGQRVGLITNHTGVNRQGERTIDLLHNSPRVTLSAIFSPEHGLEGKLDTANIEHTSDRKTGLPVFSLYGESRRPKLEQLAGIDTLVFDIQDIGARFYTYVSTLGMAMEAAAQHGLRFVVLDRPNPLGGTIVEGPKLDEGKESFVGFHPIPVRHGMTIAELARLYLAERGWDLDLQIVELENWRRHDYWDATGLTWINPSPNMRSLTQALLYPGIGLLETTNLSVGRGTDTPFEVLGAPWINGQELAFALNNARLKGVRFVPIQFTPDQSKFAGEKCEGVNIIITDREGFQSVPVGLTIAYTLRSQYQNVWDTSRLNRLLANDELCNDILNTTDTEYFGSLLQSDAKAFVKRRDRFLIYP